VPFNGYSTPALKLEWRAFFPVLSAGSRVVLCRMLLLWLGFVQ
jgi:hypothetical protein